MKKNKIITVIAVVAALVALSQHSFKKTKSPASTFADSSASSTSKTPEDGGSLDRSIELGEATRQAERKSETKVVLNDPNMSKNWGLGNADAQKAWEITQGDSNIVVAVIDTGVDVKHRDLKSNLWLNPGESGKDENGKDKATNGKDDDNNGFIDDVHGWNFSGNNSNLADNHGHGTHIAGIIGAEGGNNFGISGVAPKVSLMILKYYDPLASGSNNLRNTIQAIEYAVKMGAHIINYSGGGIEYSADEFQAVKKAEQKGILFVAAAGNERSNSDVTHYYPANYGLKNIISVTAIDPRTETLPSSNYGKRTVDLAAPGQDIYSTLPGGQFGLLTGTSQATAFVSGVAALVKAQFPTFDAFEIKKYILKTGDYSTSLQAKTGTARKLNIYKALTTLDTNVGVNGTIIDNAQQIQVLSDSKVQAPSQDPLNQFKSLGQSLIKGSTPAPAESGRSRSLSSEGVDPNL